MKFRHALLTTWLSLALVACADAAIPNRALSADGGAPPVSNPEPSDSAMPEVERDAAAVSAPDAGMVVVVNPAGSIRADIAEGICAAQEACTGQASLATGNQPCEEDLVQRLSQDTLAKLSASFAAGNVTYDATKMQTCKDDLKALGCAVRAHRLPPSCQVAIVGQLDFGDTCRTDLECAGDAFCGPGSTTSCSSVCKPRLAEGEACSGDTECTDGSFCEYADNDSTRTCTAPRTAGQRCRGYYDPLCAPDLECFQKDLIDLSFVCKARGSVYTGARDALCFSATGNLCEEASNSGPPLACFMDSRTCRPQVASGGACSLARPDACPLEEFCDTDVGRCQPRLGENEPCNPARPRYCAEGHACLAAPLGGTFGAYCLPMANLNDPCVVGAQCYSGYCDGTDKTCQLKPPCQ